MARTSRAVPDAHFFAKLPRTLIDHPVPTPPQVATSHPQHLATCGPVLIRQGYAEFPYAEFPYAGPLRGGRYLNKVREGTAALL
jgi:hypothetical protein